MYRDKKHLLFLRYQLADQITIPKTSSDWADMQRLDNKYKIIFHMKEGLINSTNTKDGANSTVRNPVCVRVKVRASVGVKVRVSVRIKVRVRVNPTLNSCRQKIKILKDNEYE